MKPRLTRVPRSPQLALRFEADTPDRTVRWCDGAEFAYLGGIATVCVATPRDAAVLEGRVLYLPQPPGATPRQIQDGVEAWLRQEAGRVIGVSLEREAQRIGCPLPGWSFSFSARAGWVQHHADGSLRLNWRLIEQPPDTIDQVVAAAVAALPRAGVTGDLWGIPEV